MNSYKMSNGQRIAKSTIDAKVREAKQEKLRLFFEEHGYYFCEDCCQNDCKPIDVSHNISVDECQKRGMSEYAWDLSNLTLRGRKHHQKKDGLNLQFNK